MSRPTRRRHHQKDNCPRSPASSDLPGSLSVLLQEELRDYKSLIAVGRVGSWEGGVFIKHRIVLPPVTCSVSSRALVLVVKMPFSQDQPLLHIPRPCVPGCCTECWSRPPSSVHFRTAPRLHCLEQPHPSWSEPSPPPAGGARLS